MGYPTSDMPPHKSDLRIPADRAYIIVAKRAAAGFAAVAGLHLEAVDDVVIAVTQACEHAISRLQHHVGEGVGHLRLDFTVEGHRLDVQVRSVCSRAELGTAKAQRVEEEKRRIAELERRLTVQHDEVHAANQLAIQVMGLFVDDFGYRVDDRTGATRVRLTKFRVS